MGVAWAGPPHFFMVKEAYMRSWLELTFIYFTKGYHWYQSARSPHVTCPLFRYFLIFGKGRFQHSCVIRLQIVLSRVCSREYVSLHAPRGPYLRLLYTWKNHSFTWNFWHKRPTPSIFCVRPPSLFQHTSPIWIQISVLWEKGGVSSCFQNGFTCRRRWAPKDDDNTDTASRRAAECWTLKKHVFFPYPAYLNPNMFTLLIISTSHPPPGGRVSAF